MDIAGALKLPGIAAVLSADDVPGRKTFGLEAADQPVLADGQIRYQGEPILIIAADHPETARRAAAAVTVDYEALTPVTDAEAALQPGAEPVHPDGNLVRHVRIRRGDPQAPADIMVSGCYQVGMQDQAFLGPESGLAVPAEDGGIELYVATQWLHVDQAQIAASLGMPEDKVRLVLAGVGGAFGAREDLSMQIHACLLALHTGRPVKMVYSREESFFGHVHRHPATLYYEHGITTDGRLVSVSARVYLDGGAYMSSSPAVVANAATLGAGPYEVPNVAIDVYAAYTNNPPCGAMRGFGAVQAAFAYESQMDECARRLGADPVEFRIRNAMSEGSVMPTGQVVDSAAPVAELLRRVRDAPMPPPPAWSAAPPGQHGRRPSGGSRATGVRGVPGAWAAPPGQHDHPAGAAGHRERVPPGTGRHAARRRRRAHPEPGHAGRLGDRPAVVVHGDVRLGERCHVGHGQLLDRRQPEQHHHHDRALPVRHFHRPDPRVEQVEHRAAGDRPCAGSHGHARPRPGAGRGHQPQPVLLRLRRGQHRGLP
jgi:CO/xanthine dehydrogenase Mo-binding subunit